MKQRLLLSAFILSFFITFSSLSQTYKVDEMRTYTWDGSPDWVLATTHKFTYDNEGNKATKQEIINAPSTQASLQFINTYNASNNIIKSVTQQWNMGWQDLSQSTYDYDGSGNLDVVTTQTYISMVWQNSSRLIYEYDGANNLTYLTTQSYISMGWQNSLQTEYEYDGANNLIRTTAQLVYDAGTMTFLPSAFLSTQELLEYTGSDISKETHQKWEPGTGWVSTEIFEITIFESGLPKEAIDSTWNTFTNMWEIERSVKTYEMGLDKKTEYYDPDGFGGWDLNGQSEITYSGNQVEKVTEQDWVGSDWVIYERTSFGYDGNGNRTEVISEDNDSGSLMFVSKVESDYSVVNPFNLSSDLFNKTSFKVYPNPASDVLNISSSNPIEKMEMYNVIGGKVMQSSNTKQFNIERLKSGIYLLKVFSTNGSATKKIVIK
ncbi:T9SS type A sorting domain-containing protein [Algibacter sp. 2305UL17-15]|uniref:T9SS type A sorting domain-containing protein n=1 Tax=Algibacter sp. 2305UL17-15 TaxID=3231268 RepID=UPI003457A950